MAAAVASCRNVEGDNFLGVHEERDERSKCVLEKGISHDQIGSDPCT
jgi:hypothetical protein